MQELSTELKKYMKMENLKIFEHRLRDLAEESDEPQPSEPLT